MKNIVILVSGGGTNLQRIIDCIDNGEIPNAKIALEDKPQLLESVAKFVRS